MQKVRRFGVADDPPDGGAGDTQRGDASVSDEPHISPSNPARDTPSAGDAYKICRCSGVALERAAAYLVNLGEERRPAICSSHCSHEVRGTPMARTRAPWVKQPRFH